MSTGGDHSTVIKHILAAQATASKYIYEKKKKSCYDQKSATEMGSMKINRE